MILEREIKDAKMSSFSSDFQTLIKKLISFYSLYELLMSLRRACNKLTGSKYLDGYKPCSDFSWCSVIPTPI